MLSLNNKITVSHGINDTLFTEDDAQYIDGIAGYGSVIFGHSNNQITATVKEQIEKLWTASRFQTTVNIEAYSKLTELLPGNYYLAEMYSTGMEGVEFTARIASCVTSRREFAGYERAMHGKSIATSSLSWKNVFSPESGFHRLPFLPDFTEEYSLNALEKILKTGNIAALYIEPILGSSGGVSASPQFYKNAVDLCRKYGTLTVFDEVLTCFYRAGSLFQFFELDVSPDIIVLGKAIANGFPVSAVVVRDDITITKAMLPGSTYSSNPVAASAVSATIEYMKGHDIDNALNYLEDSIRKLSKSIEEHDIKLRGKGAYWCLELPDNESANRLNEWVFSNKVLLSGSGKYIRFTPALTMERNNIDKVIDILSKGFCNVSR